MDDGSCRELCFPCVFPVVEEGFDDLVPGTPLVAQSAGWATVAGTQGPLVATDGTDAYIDLREGDYLYYTVGAAAGVVALQFQLMTEGTAYYRLQAEEAPEAAQTVAVRVYPDGTVEVRGTMNGGGGIDYSTIDTTFASGFVPGEDNLLSHLVNLDLDLWEVFLLSLIHI